MRENEAHITLVMADGTRAALDILGFDSFHSLMFYSHDEIAEGPGGTEKMSQVWHAFTVIPILELRG